MTNYDIRHKIDSIKSNIPMRTLFERDGHKLTRSGPLWKCCCPFHLEKSPSCNIWPDHFHCFGCAARGDVFGYVMQRDRCTFLEAFERLSGGEPLKSFAPLPMRASVKPTEPELPRDYFRNMWQAWAKSTSETNLKEVAFAFAETLGVNPESLCNLGMVVTEESNFAFPMSDHTGRFIGIRLRDHNGKKWAVKGSKQGLFIPMIQPSKDMFVTEGPTDCAALLSMGVYAIGKASAMQDPTEIVKFIVLHKIRRVIVIADNDEAGLKGATKLIDVCPVPCAELVLPAKDAREFYKAGGTKKLIETLLGNVVWRHPRK